MMTIGERIREARISRHLTQQELVGDCITRNMLSKIENGSATPSVRTLEYLARVMDLPPGAFLSDAPTPASQPPITDTPGRIALLKALLEAGDGDFPAALREAKQEWTETGLALVEMEARYTAALAQETYAAPGKSGM